MTLVLRYIARSDQGLVRSNNEDSAYAGPRLLALADGMGGHAAGEVASRLVIESMRSLDDDDATGDLLAALNRATQAGNHAIADQVEEKPELDGMGTTLTAILFAGSRIGLCHIGDSRGYLYRDGELTQITRDDTFVQSLVDEGRITPEQAHTHPQRSLIMRALTGAEVDPTLIVREARAGDRYLLCSDGLSDVVSEETLAETLGTVTDYRECADRLIELALRGGGPDNVTVVLADVVDTDYGDSRPIVGGAAGTGEDAYTPDPKTAAGRAAALRPPLELPQQPTILPDDDEPVHRSHKGRWFTVAFIVLVIAALVAGFFVLRGYMHRTYYIGQQDSKVVVFQGSPDAVLFYSVSNLTQKGCIVDPDKDSASITFVPVGDTNCHELNVADLQPFSQSAVRDHRISGKPLSEILGTTSELELLPLCKPPMPDVHDRSTPAQPAPSPAPSAAPAPNPAPAQPVPATYRAVPATIHVAPVTEQPTPSGTPPAPGATTGHPSTPHPSTSPTSPSADQPGTNCREP
ncbi:PP2C family protein-serine/threonine phosphatase [Gordonia sp. DT30]|uniref:PP2C family protein-serine/threonine phosphatase n=1 Tax=unclassified Gordonia (in: high G+C Gram-positive bacteria) TaxID=2657482 RepID=UPI003CE7A538